jgi:hypothetical protein
MKVQNIGSIVSFQELAIGRYFVPIVKGYDVSFVRVKISDTHYGIVGDTSITIKEWDLHCKVQNVYMQTPLLLNHKM